ncbi:hypothetical protein MHU86_7538 [Fragilaria crotonensis]|nr:hypothetical protein MHU86_7538 [Fragilaria crotonensis]
MATRIESFNNTLFSGDNTNCNYGHKDLSRTAHTTPESSRRRTLDEMKTASESNTSTTDTNVGPVSESQQEGQINASPSKKKYRYLQDDMEEMSLGSDVSMSTGNTDTPMKHRIREFLLPDSSSLDDSDEFPSQTPDLDTQYNLQSDPEGGGPK